MPKNNVKPPEIIRKETFFLATPLLYFFAFYGVDNSLLEMAAQ